MTAEQAVPDSLAAVAKREGGAYTVTSSWVLAGGSLKSATRFAAKHKAGVLDALGFDGYAVAGEFFFQSLWAFHGIDAKRQEKVEAKVYRFGGGTGVARYSRVFTVMVGKRSLELHVDVLPGVLPLLLGREFGAAQKLLVEIASGDVWREGGELLTRNLPTGLVYLSLDGCADVGANADRYKHLFAAVKEQSGGMEMPQAGSAEAPEQVEQVSEI